MNWEKVNFSNVVKDITGGNVKFQTNEYNHVGSFPIIDQGSNEIAGFTEKKEFVKRTKDVVVFGDHTKCLKYVDFDFCLGADGVKVFEPIDKLDSKFLYFYLKTINLPDVGYSRHFKFLKEIQIPLPPLPTQKRIAEILDAADALRRKDQALLKKYDELAQAIFIDMFGDPVKNEKGWEVKKLGEIVTSLDNQRVPIESSLRANISGEYPYYGASGIIDYVNDFIFSETNLLIGEDGANLLARSSPIAFLAYGNYWVNNHAHVLGSKNKGLLKYLEFWFNSISLEPYITGSAQPKLNGSKLMNIKVPYPNLELIFKFNSILELLNKQKPSNKNSESLFSSLIQKAFTGELVA